MQVNTYDFWHLTDTINVLKVPYFQRGYVWTQENWERLLESLKTLNKPNFLGSIILKEEKTEAKGAKPNCIIIDGQQRITTLSILVKACYDVLTIKNEKKSEAYARAPMSYLADRYNEDTPLKLQHSMKDEEAFRRVIKDLEEDNIEKSIEDLFNSYSETRKRKSKSNPKTKKEMPQIIKCYKYFYDHFIQQPNAAKDILTYLVYDRYPLLVGILLDNNDDEEQTVFETLNSAGSKLSISDIIKNDIFLSIKDSNGGNDDQAKELYTKYWEKQFEPAEESDKDVYDFWQGEQKSFNHLTQLLSAYALIKSKFGKTKQRFELRDNRNVLPKFFYEYFKTSKDHKNKLDEITQYANLYKAFKEIGDPIQGNSYSATRTDKEGVIARLSLLLNELNISSFDPLIMQILFMHKENKTPSLDICSYFSQLETFVIIKGILGANANEYTKHAQIFLDSIINEGKFSLESALKQLRQEVFGIGDQNKVLDGLNSNIKIPLAKQILFGLELYEHAKQGGVSELTQIEYKPIELEHIMPIKWKEYWLDNIKEDTPEYYKREEAIHKLGNMTLLTSKMNKNLRNHSFQDKMEKLRKTTIFPLHKKHILDPYEQGTIN